jgi:hypothetical protein
MSDLEEQLRARLQTDPVRVPVDLDAVLESGHEAVRGRRLGWTVAGLATLAVVASIVTPTLIARTVPAVPSVAPVASPSAPSSPTAAASSGIEGRTWQLDARTGSWVDDDSGITLRVDGARVSGWSGCGDYIATLSRDGARWTLSGVRIPSPIPCPSAPGTHVGTYIDRLDKVTAGELIPPGPTLRLRTPDGDLLFHADR